MAAVLDNALLADEFHEAPDAVWVKFARRYSEFGSPFVPCQEDIRTMEQAVATHPRSVIAKVSTALMLGVTPGIALMSWPRGTRLLAAEISRAVIDALWPGDVSGVREAICASWLDIPVARKSCDVVVADGSLSTCRYPNEVRDLLRAVAELLADGGLFVCRCYLRPLVQESLDAVFAAAFSDAGLRVDQFKMRLYTALQHSASEGVAVREAARVMYKYGVDRHVMQHRFGWSPGTIEPFLSWPVLDSVYSFPSLDELKALVNECFEVVSVRYPRYELGDRCPTVVMRPIRAIEHLRGTGRLSNVWSRHHGLCREFIG
jgi:hypothetical protein